MAAPADPVCFIDGASRGNPGHAGIGAVYLSEDTAEPLFTLSVYIGETTNNVAEYFALIHALQETLIRKLDRIHVRTDSELLSKQVNGEYAVKNKELVRLFGLVKHLQRGLREFSITHVPREQNHRADKLATQAADRKA